VGEPANDGRGNHHTRTVPRDNRSLASSVANIIKLESKKLAKERDSEGRVKDKIEGHMKKLPVPWRVVSKSRADQSRMGVRSGAIRTQHGSKSFSLNVKRDIQKRCRGIPVHRADRKGRRQTGTSKTHGYKGERKKEADKTWGPELVISQSGGKRN